MCKFFTLTDIFCITRNIDEIGLEDSDVVAENNKIRGTNLTELCQSNNLVLRYANKLWF